MVRIFLKFPVKSIFALLVCLVPLQSLHAGDDAHLTKAVDNKIRMEKDIARDANRKPAAIMAFSGVKQGQVIIDMIAGGGYYSELFSLAVGNKGSVYTQLSRAKDERVALFRNMKKLTDRNLADMTGEADLIFTALNYHDMVNNDKFDRAAVLAGVKAHLKADGVFVVIDHAAAEGTGKSMTNSLHRIEKAFVIEEVQMAGFKLDGESILLQNDNDNRRDKVFNPSVRGRTDRFVLRFKKVD